MCVFRMTRKPWFVAKEVCKILGYSNTRDAISKHCKGGRKTRLPSKGGMQEAAIIPKAMSIVSSSGPNFQPLNGLKIGSRLKFSPPSARQVPMIQFSSKPSTTPPRCFSEQITRTPMSPRHLTHQQKPLFNFQRRTRICNEKRQFCKRGQKHLNKKPTKTDRSLKPSRG